MDLWTMGMVVSSLVALAAGFAIRLHSALEQSDRVIIDIDGELFEVRRRHAKDDIQRAVARLIQPLAGKQPAAPGPMHPRHLPN